MARILLAWEYGGGLGHIRGLRPIADRLCELGHEIVWAVRNVGPAASALGDRKQRVLQAPISRPKRSEREAASFCDVMITLGFGDQAELDQLVRAWLATIELVRPDLIISDFSPTASLAVRIAQVPILSLGNGYTLPPAVSPLPPTQPWLAVPKRRLEAADALVTGTVNNVLAARGVEGIAMAAEILRPGAVMQCTFPQLDHYGERPGDTYYGPMVDRLAPAAAASEILGRERIFLYLNWAEPRTELILREIKRSGVPGLGFVSGVPRQARKDLSSRKFELTDQPQDLSVHLASTRLLISHGGMGTTTQSLLAGIPALMLPSQQEQAMYCHRVEAGGLGIAVPRQAKPATYGTLLQSAMDPALVERTAAFAAEHGGFDPVTLYGEIVARAEALLAGR